MLIYVNLSKNGTCMTNNLGTHDDVLCRHGRSDDLEFRV